MGSGISGLAAAWLLSRRHEVELFEKDDRLGGHAHTHTVVSGGRELQLDSGFIVYNERTYPNFTRLLARLGVPGQKSDMSFGVRCRRCRLEYSSRGLAGLFAQKRRVLQPSHLSMLADIPRFNRRARAFLGNGAADRPLDEFLARGRHSRGFASHFLLPMAGAIWSAPTADVRGFSTRSFLRFFDNHGWLTLDGAHQWWTVTGGSRAYVEAIARPLGGRIRLATPVTAIRRDAGGVGLEAAGGYQARYDKVVIATHADQALALLADASGAESATLARFRYSSNETVLHTDVAALPRARDAWASWNCDISDCASETAPVSVTYHLNRLQAIPSTTPYCVSLNRPRPAADKVLATMTYTHPVMDADAVQAQRDLAQLSGSRHTLFCGAHLGWGFHEDGLNSAIRAAEQLGVAF